MTDDERLAELIDAVDELTQGDLRTVTDEFENAESVETLADMRVSLEEAEKYLSKVLNQVKALRKKAK